LSNAQEVKMKTKKDGGMKEKVAISHDMLTCLRNQGKKIK